MNEPQPADPTWPRYTSVRFPAYRYVPGRSPHPRRDPRGHSFGGPEVRPVAVDPARWAACELYLAGVDLFNFAYFWESHEAFEALWIGAGRGGVLAGFFQGLVQIAASELKRFLGASDGGRALAERGLGRLRGAPSPWLGLDVRELEGQIEARISGARPVQPLLLLGIR